MGNTRISGNRIVLKSTGQTIGLIEDDPTPEEIAQAKALHADFLAREKAKEAKWAAERKERERAARREELKDGAQALIGIPLAIAAVAVLAYLIWIFPIYGFDPSPLWTD